MTLSLAVTTATSHHVIGISEMKVSRRREDTLITYSLGSCVGLTLFDPVAGVGGLIHCLLPTGTLDAEKARRQPCMFVDTGVPALLAAVLDAGASRRSLVAKAAGGANVFDDGGLFRIGERNTTMLRKILWKNEILLSAEDMGGSKARTLSLEMSTGKCHLRTLQGKAEL
jgi:chemotaxis protein CheD